jgi:hypothetical protein
MFSIVNRHASPFLNNSQTGKKSQPQMQLQMNSHRQLLIKPAFNTPVQPKQPSFAPSDGDKIKWGRPTWRFFHTIAHKIKPEYFKQVRKDLLDTIYSICSTLPCPVCSQHAKQYMNAINFNTIQTKDDLKTLLFDFHNAVNVRKNYQPFNRELLDSTYDGVNTANVAREFMFHYKDKHRSIKMVADDLMRSKIAVNIQNWFNNVYQFMDP